MKRYKFYIDEVISLKHKVIIEIPSEMSAIDISESIESECNLISDLTGCIEKFGCKQIDFAEDVHGKRDILVNTCKKIEDSKN
ncbi:hypothetical protein RHG08_20810 [Clostridioides difficile]|nr:hypothetical protein [Clostridioides difficile]